MSAVMSADQLDDWLGAGRRALCDGKLKQACTLLDRVLAVSKHPEALHLKGAALLKLGQVRAAVELIEQAVAGDARPIISPTSAPPTTFCAIAAALKPLIAKPSLSTPIMSTRPTTSPICCAKEGRLRKR